MTGLLLAALLQAALPQSPPPAPAPAAASEVEPLTVIAPGPDTVWCVRFPDSRSRAQQPRLTCRTLAEWDAVRRVRYDSRGYQGQLALRRFGVGLDTSLLEEASMGRVRSFIAARRARQAQAEGRD